MLPYTKYTQPVGVNCLNYTKLRYAASVVSKWIPHCTGVGALILDATLHWVHLDTAFGYHTALDTTLHYSISNVSWLVQLN